MTDGVVVSAAARRELSGCGERPLSLADYASTSGIVMRLADDVWVNAPIADYNPNFVADPPHVLDHRDGRFVVRSSALEVPAFPLPVPAYHNRRNAAGEPYTSYAHTHADRVRISPVEGCGVTCQFCNLPYEFRYRTKRVEGLVEAVQTALADDQLPAYHILISGGTPRTEDHAYLNGVYAAVTSAFPGVAVDVMMVPSPGLLDVAHLDVIGIHGIAINLELYNEDAARRLMAGKARLGRQYYLDFIEDAVARLGPGRVRSLLLVGLESLDDTLAGVEALAERGCEPVLSPFRPDPATPLRSHRPPTADLLWEVHERSIEIVERRRVKLGPRCIPCMHNTLTFPDDSGYYVSYLPPSALPGTKAVA
jgi:hypothetical protein